MLEILEAHHQGRGPGRATSSCWRSWARRSRTRSLCGLGSTAPNPVLTTIRYFRDEYEAHIREKRCPAKVCKALIRYCILEDKCTGCRLCAKNCPVHCIAGRAQEAARHRPGQVHQVRHVQRGLPLRRGEDRMMATITIDDRRLEFQPPLTILRGGPQTRDPHPHPVLQRAPGPVRRLPHLPGGGRLRRRPGPPAAGLRHPGGGRDDRRPPPPQRVTEARQFIIQLLLSRAPDSPELQAIAESLGVDAGAGR